MRKCICVATIVQIILLDYSLKWFYFQKLATEANNQYKNIIMILQLVTQFVASANASNLSPLQFLYLYRTVSIMHWISFQRFATEANNQYKNIIMIATQIYFSHLVLRVWGCCESTKQEVQGGCPKNHYSMEISHDRTSFFGNLKSSSWHFLRLS